MIVGMSVAAFTLLHVVISLIGIAAGVILVAGLLTSRPLPRWAALFLLTTVLTSVTGFMFRVEAIGPPHIVGAISLLALALAIWALYGRQLTGAWRAVYIVSAVFALYLNAFVAVVQAFQKIPFFNALAPTQQEPPFLVAQVTTLAVFALLGTLAMKRFHPSAAHTK